MKAGIRCLTLTVAGIFIAKLCAAIGEMAHLINKYMFRKESTIVWDDSNP